MPTARARQVQITGIHTRFFSILAVTELTASKKGSIDGDIAIH
jgi:hypothetical protein